MLSERSISILVPLLLLGVPAACTRAQESQPLTLDDALAYALNHNPRLAAAAARIESAQGRVALARAQVQPAVSFTASGRLQAPVPKIHLRLPLPDWLPIHLPTLAFDVGRADQATVGVGVVWPLWTGGRAEAAVGAARAQTDAAEADLQQATEQLLYETAVTYHEVSRARHAQEGAEAGLRRAREDLRTAQVSWEAGVMTEAAVAAAEAQQRRAEQDLALARSAITDAEQRLNQLLARDLDEPVTLVEQTVSIDDIADPAQAQAAALATRPELLALAYRRQAARAAIDQAAAERQPALAAVAQAAWQTKTPFMPSATEAIGLQFSWPLFDAPSRAEERIAHATVQETEQTERDLEGVIAVQVAETARRVTDARERLAAAQEAVRASEAAASAAQAGYQAGTATRQELTAAETTLEEARAREAQARAGLGIALLSRARALGLMRALFLVPPEEAGKP